MYHLSPCCRRHRRCRRINAGLIHDYKRARQRTGREEATMQERRSDYRKIAEATTRPRARTLIGGRIGDASCPRGARAAHYHKSIPAGVRGRQSALTSLFNLCGARANANYGQSRAERGNIGGRCGRRTRARVCDAVHTVWCAACVARSRRK